MFSQQMKKQLDRKQLVFEQVYLLPHCHFHFIKCTYSETTVYSDRLSLHYTPISDAFDNMLYDLLDDQ